MTYKVMSLHAKLNRHLGYCLIISDPVTSEEFCIGTLKSGVWGKVQFSSITKNE